MKRPLVNPYSHVRPGGYAWWYFDAVSDDGTRALTAIFFIGSVFSPTTPRAFVAASRRAPRSTSGSTSRSTSAASSARGS